MGGKSVAAKIWWQWQASNGKGTSEETAQKRLTNQIARNTDQWQTMQKDNGTASEKAEDVGEGRS